MRQQCINSAEKAIGRSFNDGEVDFVDAAIARAGADLQAQDPDAWNQMSPAEQWRAAGQRAAEVMRAEAQQLVEQAEGGAQIEETRRPEGEAFGQTFYSAVERFVEASTTQRASGAQWWATISKAPGVKREELETLGLEEFLKLSGADRAFTKEDVLAYVRANGVQIEETVLGGEASDAELQRQLLPLIEERDRLGQERQAIWTNPEAVRTDRGPRPEIEERDGFFFVGARRYQTRQGAEDAATARASTTRTITDSALAQRENEISQRIAELNEEIAFLESETRRSTSIYDTKWSTYTLPGGEGYREVLLRLPTRQTQISFEEWWAQTKVGDIANASPRALELARNEYAARGQNVVNPANFRSSHFDQPNIIAHFRLKKRIGFNGERILALEEIQSDWGQGLRKEKEAQDSYIERNLDTIIKRMKDAGVLTEVCD